jgi:hypothetical protein
VAAVTLVLIALGNWVIGAALAASVFLTVALLNLVIDPYQKYREPKRYRTYYSRPRHLNPGLARHRSYDTALVGSSMIGSFSPSMVEAEMGGTCVKFPVYGASGRELRMTLEPVLRAGRAKTILFTLDHYSLKGRWDRLPFTGRAVPYHIYAGHPAAHLRYLFGLDTLAQGFKVLRKNSSCRKQERFDPDHYGWHPDSTDYGAEITLARWRKNDPVLIKDPAEHTFPVMRECYDRNLLPLLRSTAGIRFFMFFPTYSILAWADAGQAGIMDHVFELQRHVVASVDDLENVTVHDFQAREWITDLDNFSDVVHFRPERARELLRNLNAGADRVTVKEPGDAPAFIRKTLADFELPAR